MANWQTKLDVRDLWKQHDDGEITVQQIATEMANRLEKLKWPIDLTGIAPGRDKFVEELQSLAEDEDADVDNFDDVLARLYDWADMPVTPREDILGGRKACWIATRF